MWRDRFGVLVITLLFALFVGSILLLLVAVVTDARGENAMLPFPPNSTVPGLIAQWRMNDDAANTAVDDCRGSLNGTLGGGDNTADLSEAGILNKALNLDTATADVISMGTSPLLFPSGAMTLSIWFKTAAGGTNQLVSWAGVDNSFFYESVGASYRFYYWRDNNTNAAGWTSSPRADDGGWHHVVLLVPDRSAQSTTGILCYQDNVALTRVVTAETTAVDTSETGFIIGTTNAAFGDFVVDDTRLYNRVLSSGEIATLYNSGNGTEK